MYFLDDWFHKKRYDNNSLYDIGNGTWLFVYGIWLPLRACISALVKLFIDVFKSISKMIATWMPNQQSPYIYIYIYIAIVIVIQDKMTSNSIWFLKQYIFTSIHHYACYITDLKTDHIHVRSRFNHNSQRMGNLCKNALYPTCMLSW